MDQVHRGFSHDIQLSPVMERTELDISTLSNLPSGSIFDPPEGNEVPPRQQELSFGDLEQQLLSPLDEDSESLPSTLEPEVRLTRSKTGTTSKRQSLAPEEVVDSVAVEPKNKGKRRSTKKVSKETQVMPRMLAPVRKRASKKKGTEDPEMKENMPPKMSNEQPQSSGRNRVFKKEVNKEPEALRSEETNAPKKLQPFRKVHMTSGIERSPRSSSPLPTSTSAHEDNILPSELSIHGIGSSPRSSSSPLATSMSRTYPYYNLERSEPSVNETSRYGTSGLNQTDATSSLSEGENVKIESQNLRKIISRKRLSRALESVPDDGQGPSHGTEENMATPLSGLTINIQPRSGSFGIRVSKGQILVSSKHNDESKKTTSTNKKNKKKKRGSKKKSRHERRSRKKSWTSESDESDESSCSSSSCDPCDSCSSCSDRSTCSSCDSTASSSGCDHRHCHHHC